jgi:hypothetical protein
MRTGLGRRTASPIGKGAFASANFPAFDALEGSGLSQDRGVQSGRVHDRGSQTRDSLLPQARVQCASDTTRAVFALARPAISTPCHCNLICC